MSSNQQLPPAPPPMTPAGGQNPYDFIMNEQPPKKSLFSGNSMKQRIMIVVGGGLVLLIIFMVIFSVLAGNKKTNIQELVAIAQQQSELIRISGIGVQKARSTTAKNLAITTQLSITSEQQALVATLKNQGRKLSSKDLALGKNSKTDTLLTQGEQNNRFDEVFIDEIQKELLAYQKSVKSAYQSATNTKVKQALQIQFKNASILANVKEE
jgi:hypothetical protein